MAENKDRDRDLIVAERRAWAGDEITIHPAGTPIPPPPVSDEEGDDEE